MKWGRAVLGGLLAEVLVFLIVTPVGLMIGLDTVQAQPVGSIPVLNYAIVIASFIAPLLLTQWVARRLTSQFVVHGFLVGFTAFVLYMIPMLLTGESQPLAYWIAHAAKIVGGLTGGFIAARRHAARGTTVTV